MLECREDTGHEFHTLGECRRICTNGFVCFSVRHSDWRRRQAQKSVSAKRATRGLRGRAHGRGQNLPDAQQFFAAGQPVIDACAAGPGVDDEGGRTDSTPQWSATAGCSVALTSTTCTRSPNRPEAAASAGFWAVRQTGQSCVVKYSTAAAPGRSASRPGAARAAAQAAQLQPVPGPVEGQTGRDDEESYNNPIKKSVQV